MRSQARHGGGIAFFFILFGVLLFPALSRAQDSTLNLSGLSNCSLADLDSNIEFENEPDDYSAIVLHSRNISNHSCTVDQRNGLSFLPDRVDGHEPFTVCYDCGGPSPDQSPMLRPVVLETGASVSQKFRWKTKQSSESVPCLEPKWMSDPVLLIAPSLLKKVCSNIEAGHVAADPPEKVDVEASNDPGLHALELASETGRYYAGQKVSLRLSSPDNGQIPSDHNATCPTLYLRQRSPDGATRIDEIEPLAFKGCPRLVLGHEPGDWRSGFEIDSGANTRWTGVGTHEMQVFQLVGSADEPRPRFISSNPLRIQIDDPAAIPRKWGTRVKGIAADITLDKDTFRLGEDVPLHLAIEDFDANLPLYSWDPVWDPCMTVGIQVLGLDGHPLARGARYPDISLCSGHGFGPRPFAQGKIVPIERTLANEGWLPNHLGTYKIVVSWAACSGSKDQAQVPDLNRKLKLYAVARAEATIHIVAGSGPSSSSRASN